MLCAAQFVAEYWYWLPGACGEGDAWKREGSDKKTFKAEIMLCDYVI